MAVDEYYQRYADQGYVFSDEILTRYAISLATKPFVILSGISGTGKTKIAQLFEVPGLTGSRGASEGNVREQGDPPAARRDYILLTVTDGLINHDGRANLAFADLPAVLEAGEVEDLERQIEEKLAANDGGNICEPKLISVEAPDGTELTIGLYLQRASSPLVRLRVKSRKKGSEPEYDCQAYFRENYEVGDVLKLEKVGKHRLQIIEINNERVVAERRAQVQERFQELENKCFIAVKSSWTDPSELFGYYNPLTQKYCLTKFLRFLLMAKDYPEMPFFVILDEMNLARVEHYFSDFLSCMESRVVLQDGTVKQEGVHLHSGSNLIETDDDEYEEIPGTIEIPLNLYVTGTVNIDDTTYMFSPKVLDRANVIEFNEVYLGRGQAPAGQKLSSWPDFDKYTKSDFRMYDVLEQRSKDDIEGVLLVLKKYNMHFGYRTIAEISHFILNSKEFIAEEQRVEEFALDVQILQKVLPKFHGSYAKLHDVLRELIFFLSGSEGNLDGFDLTQIRAIDIENTRFKRSLEKLQKMYETLVSQGFASFIE